MPQASTTVEAEEPDYLHIPDHSTIFQRPIEARCRTPEAIKKAVRETVIHEVGHYFGLDDERLEELLEQ